MRIYIRDGAGQLTAFINKSLSFVTIHDKNNNIWLETSKFLCSINARKFTDLSSSFASDFILPTNIKDVSFINYIIKH